MAFNGGSLEDCFSNVFALTEMSGLKWRCFVTPSNAPRGVPVQSDHVLKAYSKCLQEGYICTWRRKPLNMSNEFEALPVPSFTNNISKELWLFWFSTDPPEKLEEYTKGLERGDDSEGGLASNGIPYEIRVLFFKAIHTGVERCLAKRGLFRFGRWFVKPLKNLTAGQHAMTEEYLMAFNLQFFVHGSNTVCTTLNGQRQPTVLKLSKRHLDSNRRIPVLLGPWSFRGTLLPSSEYDAARMQANMEREYEEWKEYHILEPEPEEGEEPLKKESLPKMVVIELDGIRMLYPVNMVCVTLNDDYAVMKDKNSSDSTEMVPSELAVTKDSRRNALIVGNIGVQAYFQGIVQDAHLKKMVKKRPSAKLPANDFNTLQDTRETKDDFKWNFAKPHRCIKEKNCRHCIFKEPPGFKADSEAAPSEMFQPLLVGNPTQPGQLRQNPSHALLRKREKRKSRNTYHGRTVNTNDDSCSDSERSCSSSDEERVPPWADTDKKRIVTGLYTPSEMVSRAYKPSTSSDASDDEIAQYSPFTPITVVSPCHGCHWPTGTRGSVTDATFNEIFQPVRSKTPVSASQAEKMKDYDYYYNPTLRKDPVFMPYHNKRTGDKRASTYPPNLLLPLSPDQPGSQETIPATTSPPPELDKTNGIYDPAVTMEPFKEKEKSLSRLPLPNDEIIRETVLVKKIEGIFDWPEIEKFDMSHLNKVGAEDFNVKGNIFGSPFVPPKDDEESSVDQYEADSDETRGLGEGPSGISTTCEMETSIDDSAMEVDGPAYNILSPPASNERMDYMSSYPRTGGPPSVSESLNKIYPTPPSILAESQQSPADNMMHMSQNCQEPVPTTPIQTEPNLMRRIKEEPMDMDENDQNTMDLNNSVESVGQQCRPTTPPSRLIVKYEKVEKQPDSFDVRRKSVVMGVYNEVGSQPLCSGTNKFILDFSGRFGLKVNKRRTFARSVTMRMPPDYQKLCQKLNERVKQDVPCTSAVNRYPPINAALYRVAPITATANPSYKAIFNFTPPSHPTTPLGMPPSYGGPPGQAMAMRQPQMMGGPMGRGGMGMPPYGHPGYQQPQYGQHGMGAVGNLTNYVNNTMPPMYGGMAGGMGGGMGMHPSMMGMGMNPMGPPMTPMGPGPHMGMYGNPGPMMQPTMQPNIMYNDPMMQPQMMPQPNNMMYMQNHQYMAMNNQHNMQNHNMVMQPMRNPMQNYQNQHPMNMMNQQPQGYGNMPCIPQNTVAIPPPRESNIAEGNSVVLAIILQDTILDLHYDTVFDSCPICSCNMSIRARELGLYISPSDILRASPEQQAKVIQFWNGFTKTSNPCNCGFSAVRHRYLSMQSGLFSEDSSEATGGLDGVAPINPSFGNYALFDSRDRNDLNMVNLLRIFCLREYAGKMVHQIAYFMEYADKAIAPQDVDITSGGNSYYIVSQIDSTELMLLGECTLEMSLVNGSRPRNRPNVTGSHKFLPIFHPWGLQVANEMREPKEAEWRCLLTEVTPILEESMRIARCATNVGAIKVVEGPLTWKSITSKRQKVGTASGAEDDCHTAEPVPYVLVGHEDKNLIKLAAQSIRLWESNSLAPVDQTKDILYVAIIPDDDIIHEKATAYLEELSQMYERMRLGRHIAWNLGDIKDGIVRAGAHIYGKGGSADICNFMNRIPADPEQDNKLLRNRIGLFTLGMEEQLSNAFKKNPDMFERSVYRQALALDGRAKKQAATAQAAKAEKSKANRAKDQNNGESMPSNGPTSSTASKVSPTPPGSTQEQPGLQDLLVDNQQQNGPIPIPAKSRTIFNELPPLEAEDTPVDDPGTLSQIVVIYVFNPFTWGTHARSAIGAQLSTLALFRCFNAICNRIPIQLRTQLHLEIIPMEHMGAITGMVPDMMNDGKGHMDVYEKGENERRWTVGYVPTDAMRTLAFSIYSAPRVLTPTCVKDVKARCMTKFGPGSALLDNVAEYERNQNNNPLMFSVPSSPYHLAPQPFLAPDPKTNVYTHVPQDELVIYVTYCLIGADFLCATVTDASGKMNDSCLINIRPATKSTNVRYRNKTQILDAMTRFWYYIQGVIFSDSRNCRLVIGRLGKIGHGEFRAWSYLLGKVSLRRASTRAKEICDSCCEMPGTTGTPAILSACLISTEPEPYLRVFPGYFPPDSFQKGKTKPLNTPEDLSCTHIMVFPVNTSIDLSQGEQAMEDNNDDDWGALADFDLTNDEEIKDIFGVGDMDDGTAQPSASIRTGFANAFFPENAPEACQNQPLAVGFYISTAPPGDLPDWFWASCPSAKRRAPVHLKSSLHITIQCAGGDQDQGDEFITQKKSSTNDQLDNVHPLDSQQTDEVLKHVLETYNALSWLNVDVVTGDRKSCLPIHIQSLLRLYHSVTRLIV